MDVFTLQCELTVPVTQEEAFRLFEDPYNLSKITPSNLGFRVLGKERVTMRQGAQIDYRIYWMGLPLRWRTLIAAYEPPSLFVDIQEKGPYAMWMHRHTFTAVQGGTNVADLVEYALPAGPLGRLVHEVIVSKQLEQIFEYRQLQIGRLLSGRVIQTKRPVITRGKARLPG